MDDLDLDSIDANKHHFMEIECPSSSLTVSIEDYANQNIPHDLCGARFEYYDNRASLKLWSSDAEIANSFNSKPAGKEGKSIIRYFQFVRYVIFCNFLVSVWCFIGWIPHVQTARPMIEKEGMGLSSATYSDLSELMFLSTYQPSSDKVWTAMVVLGTITMMLSGPVHFLILHFWNAPPSEQYAENAKNSEEFVNDEIEYPDALQYPVGSAARRVASYLILVVICFVPIGINYGLLYVASHKALKVTFVPIKRSTFSH